MRFLIRFHSYLQPCWFFFSRRVSRTQNHRTIPYLVFSLWILTYPMLSLAQMASSPSPYPNQTSQNTNPTPVNNPNQAPPTESPNTSNTTQNTAPSNVQAQTSPQASSVPLPTQNPQTNVPPKNAYIVPTNPPASNAPAQPSSIPATQKNTIAPTVQNTVQVPSVPQVPTPPTIIPPTVPSPNQDKKTEAPKNNANPSNQSQNNSKANTQNQNAAQMSKNSSSSSRDKENKAGWLMNSNTNSDSNRSNQAKSEEKKSDENTPPKDFIQQWQENGNNPSLENNAYRPPSAWVPFFWILVLAIFGRFLVQWVRKRNIQSYQTPEWIEIVTSIPLDHQTRISFLKISDKFYMIGVTPHHIELMQEIRDPSLLLKLKTDIKDPIPQKSFTDVLLEFIQKVSPQKQPKKEILSPQNLSEFMKEQRKRLQ